MTEPRLIFPKIGPEEAVSDESTTTEVDDTADNVFGETRYPISVPLLKRDDTVKFIDFGHIYCSISLEIRNGTKRILVHVLTTCDDLEFKERFSENELPARLLAQKQAFIDQIRIHYAKDIYRQNGHW